MNPKAVEMTKHIPMMRDYECYLPHGGCGHRFKETRPVENLRQVSCIHCGTHGTEEVFHEKLGRKVHRIQIIHPDGAPRMRTDWSGQDGRTNQGIDMSNTLSVAREISSRSSLPDLLKKEREKMFESTRGEHTRMVPFKEDPSDPDSPVVWEPETVTHAGWDPGELHNVETIKEEANRPRSSFDKGKTLAESEKMLEARVGRPDEGMEMVPWEHVEKVSNDAFGKKGK